MTYDVESPGLDDNNERQFAGVQRWLSKIRPRFSTQRKSFSPSCLMTPRTSDERRLASLKEAPFDLNELVRSASNKLSDAQATVLYLGYGSNMCAETFEGKRNIKPLSQLNVRVLDLALTFDLPGVPYSEPCFANTRYRHTGNKGEKVTHQHEKDQWHKGLIGVVYEVTQADFAHIIATEGGGASYKDVLIDCYALTGDPKEELPAEPSGSTFKAHTLFSPPNVVRPDPSYAQPSPRYLKLITDGAKEHELPYEYQEYLNSIGTYHITTTKQQLGSFIFLGLWAPLFAFIFGGAGMFLDKNGRYPKWYGRLAMAIFAACWGSYDDFFKDTFGDGERTVDPKEEDGDSLNEKEELVRYEKRHYGTVIS